MSHSDPLETLAASKPAAVCGRCKNHRPMRFLRMKGSFGVDAIPCIENSSALVRCPQLKQAAVEIARPLLLLSLPLAGPAVPDSADAFYGYC